MIVGAGSFDINVGTPVIPRIVAVPEVTVFAGNQRQNSPVQLRLICGAHFVREVSGDTDDIVHHDVRLLKHRLIDALDDIAHAVASLGKSDDESVIDVPVSTRAMAQVIPWHLKMTGHSGDVVDDTHA